MAIGMGAIICTACGTGNADDHKFCKECGARLAAITAEATTSLPDNGAQAADDPASRAFNLGLRGMYDEAITEYIRALRARPNDPDLHYQLAVIYRKKKLFQNAVSELERTLELSPNHFKALLLLGNTYGEDARDHRKAIEYYGRAVELAPDYPDLRNNLGNAYRFIGENEKAVEQFEKAIDLNPAYARAFFNLGKALSQLDRFEEAELSYRRAIQIDNNHPKAHKSLAMALRKQGRHAEALTPLLKAVELDPEFARAHFRLAQLYEHLGLAAKARHHADHAAALDPTLVEQEKK